MENLQKKMVKNYFYYIKLLNKNIFFDVIIVAEYFNSLKRCLALIIFSYLYVTEFSIFFLFH